ncbi:MAG: hypothetical protein IPN70_00180 [Candidatus Moraniibacteriota bacterium]|nr:MAG: hypothetical protein IPN70_00180 [Candidatus Moranbacteria bacterium]
MIEEFDQNTFPDKDHHLEVKPIISMKIKKSLPWGVSDKKGPSEPLFRGSPMSQKDIFSMKRPTLYRQ